MGRKNKLDDSLDSIELFFDSYGYKSFTESKFGEIFNRNRHDWGVARNRYAGQVLDYLVNRKVMFENTFLSENNDSKSVYSWKTKDEFTVVAGLKSESYFSHYSALYIHQLSLQIPKTIYLNFEHKATSVISNTDNVLLQESIDKAFQSSQRKSMLSFSFLEKKIILVNGKYTNRLGVKKKK